MISKNPDRQDARLTGNHGEGRACRRNCPQGQAADKGKEDGDAPRKASCCWAPPCSPNASPGTSVLLRHW